MKPIQSPIPEYQPLSGISEPVTIREWRGLNRFDPYSIADQYFTDAANTTSDDYPAVSTRPGYSVLGGPVGSFVLGLGVWKDTELHAVFNDGTWRKWTGSSWTTLKSGLSTTAMWSFTNFEGNLGAINLIGANGVNGLHRYDGSTVQTFGDAPADIDHVTTYQNRIWGASGKELRACKLDQPAIWNDFAGTGEDSYGVEIESSRGEVINMLSGSLSKLTIGMPNSLHELYGGLPSDFTVQLITEDVGVANNASAASQAGTLYLAHHTGLHQWQGGTVPSKSFADIIRDLQTGITAAAVGADADKVYFAVPGKVLVYDTRQNIQAWSMWTGFAPTCFAMFQGALYCGDGAGRILRLNSGTTDGGSAISWRIVTRPFTNSSIARKQRWLKMWVTVELAAGSSLNIYASPSVSGSDWELVYGVTGTGTQIQRVIIPVTKFVLENTVRIKFEGVGWCRVHELTRQVRQLSLY